MSLLKRHDGRGRRSGRRVVGVIVGASLLVLGLEAPAFATHTVGAISPTSGPVDCVVVITGTGFDQPGAFAIDEVNFTGGTGINTVPADFHVVSDTEIWTTVPTGAVTGAITVSDTDPATDDSQNSAVFTVTTLPDAGGCAPTIASFTPTCGVVGTVVTVTGTNLLSHSGDDTTTGESGPPASDPIGGDVFFNPYATAAPKPPGAVESPTTLTANVPTDALDGPIRVTTPVGTVNSTTSFDVVADAAECPDDGVDGDRHERNVRLRLRAHLIGKGKVTVPDGTTECAQNVPVKIQRKRPGGWRTVKATTTSVTGSFKKRLPDKPGVYRAVARKITLPDTGDICVKDVSNRVRHRH